jgi:gliding motility-associated-like protein
LFTDNCTATIESNHQSGEFFPVGSTQITYLVTDGSGNQSSCEFQLNVIDDDAPIINCIPSVSSCDPIITFPAPIVSDNCGILSTIQLTGLASGSIFPVGNTVNTFQTTDVHGNTSTCSFTVTIYSIPQLTLQADQISCNSLADASIDLTINDSDGPFEVLWSNQATSEDLSMVAPGTYSVEVSDSYGCTSVASIAIQEPTPLEINTTNTNVTCHDGSDGAIDANVIGGTTPYFYTWSTGDNTQDIADLQSGTYVLIVSDANGCLISYGTTLNEPDSLVIQSDIQDATCDANNGSIQIQVTGGTTPYDYSWSNGTTNMNLNNSMAGTYSLAVTDKNGCIATYTGTISSVSNLMVSTLQQDVLCYGQSNGEIQVIVRNGNAPYQYNWSNGASGNVVDSLSAGNYAVLITDSFGCNTTLTITIAQPDSINLELSSPQYGSGTNISLSGGNDGSILSLTDGGTQPYNYQWSNGSTADNLYNLTAGIYSLTITDQNGCPAFKSIVLTEPFKLEMPSGFSPNADNSNDFFVVRGIEAYPENELLIFNRWGNLVYQKSNYENEWKGDNTSGEELPESTYFAILKVYGKEEITLQGYVDLRR